MTFNRIRLGLLCLALLTLAFITGPTNLIAQSSTQGSIAGSVLDSSGASIPGATVTIQNKGTNSVVKITSDATGYFKAPLLEPGTYSVSVTAANFANYRADNVTVQVSQTTSLAPRLGVASSSSEVIVTEEAPTMNLESPDFSANLNQAAMQNVPINNRRWSSLAMSTPGVVSDSNGFGLVSVRGISTLLNNVEIDGADDNQAFFSEERGRTREAYSTSGNAVREFAVNTGVYSAQYGRAAGGVINSVTKSGTNQIHGEAYYFHRESNWNAFNDYTTYSKLVNGAAATIHFKPEDLRKIYGFTAGGPLIKDKLFWIYTYDQHTHVFPVTSIPFNPLAFFTLPQAALSSGETCNTTTGALVGAPSTAVNDANACALAARQGISYQQASYDWAVLLYGNANVTAGNYGGITPITDLGLNSDLYSVPRFGFQEINNPKIDWQINPKHRLSVLGNRLRWDSPGGVQTAAADMYAPDSQGNDFVKLDYGVAKLTSLVTNNISNEVLYQYGRELDYETQQPFTAYTKAEMTGANGTPAVEADFNNGFNAGSLYYEHRAAYPDERKWQVGDIVYWNLHNHSLRFGIDTVHNYDLMNNTFKSNGDFSYNFSGNLYNDILNIKNNTVGSPTKGCDSAGQQNFTSIAKPVTGPFPCYNTYIQGFGSPLYAMSTLDFGAFAQDNWKFSPRLTLELGLRWDHETIPGPDPKLTVATGTFVPYTGMTNAPSDNMDFGPRIGFSYDVFGDGKTALRGGYGMYFGRVTNGNIENVRLNTGSPNGQFQRTWNASTANAPTYLNTFLTGSSAACTPGTSSCPASYFMASNFKLPEVMEYDIQLQQALGKGTTFSVSYLGGMGRRLPNFLDVNLNPNTTLNETVTVSNDNNGHGPLGATGSTIPTTVYTSYGNTALLGVNAPNFSSVSEFISNVNSSYNGLVAEVVNHSLKFIDFDANYTWSHALDFAQNVSTQGAAESWYDPYKNFRANYGNSSFNVPNRFVAYALYKFPNLPGSNPIKWVANGWSLNDSFQMQNGLPFTAGISTSAKPTSAIAAGFNGSGFTGQLIPGVVGYNSYQYPRRIVDDARLQKQIDFERGVNLQLVLNVFNIANHQNITGFRAAYLYTLSGLAASYNGTDGTGTSAKSFMVPNNSNSSAFMFTPRQVEIAFRLNF